MKNFSIVFLVSLILIFILNALIFFTWPIYSKINSNKHFYSTKQQKLLNLSDEDLITLHNETWRNYDKFRFIPYIGHSETNRKGKFVNFSETNGRKINRPSECEKTVYLYGGSTTFGYNVSDKQTIGQYLQNLFDVNACIYNHGRAYFYSKQENNLLINHIESNKKIDYAIFLDGVNERCGGYVYDSHLSNSFSLLTERPFNMWKKSFKQFLLTMPMSQFINSLFGSNRFVNTENSVLKIDSCENNISLNKLLENRLRVREGICEKNKINCFSFLQPIAGVHGLQIESFLSKNRQLEFKEKYEILSKVDGLIDLGFVLNDQKNLSYIDDVHYSPKTNSLIASAIYEYLK